MLGRGGWSAAGRSGLRRRLLSSTAATEPSYQDMSPDAEALKRIVFSRVSMKSFQTKAIPEEVLKAILSVTQRAPTSYNIQPYTCILVKSASAREKLASCMLGPNKVRVRTAPVSAVFAADLEPTKLVNRLINLERQRGTPENYLATLPFAVAFLAGEGRLANAFKDLFTSAVSPLQPMPSVNNLEAWSYKNTMLVAAWYMLAASSHGLHTCPMEGFDGRRVKAVLNIPDRYSIPLVVPTGYAEVKAEKDLVHKRRTPRYPAETVFFEDSFGRGYQGIPDLKPVGLEEK